MTVQCLHGSAQSRKVPTIERSYAHLAHCAPHVAGVQRVLDSKRSLEPRFSIYIAHERTLGRSMGGMARKCGGRER